MSARRPPAVLALPFLLLLTLLPATALALTAPKGGAPAPDSTVGFNELVWIPGSSHKVEQLIGDHDWADTLLATTSRTVTRFDVLGNDVGMSFVSGDSVIILFGDTIGASSQYYPTWSDFLNPYKWNAHDPLASFRVVQPDSGLLLNFYTGNADSTLLVIPVYPGGAQLAMGIDDVPNAGIDLNGSLYLICKTGAYDSAGVHVNASDSSVVVQFDPVQKTFTAGRTLSSLLLGGHFLTTALHELPMQFASSNTDSEVVIFGVGNYRASDVYLSKIRKHFFASGVNLSGNPATKYFTGLVNGQPAWSDTESLAVPVVEDNPLVDIGVGVPQNPWPNDDPTIGNLSVAWCPAAGLWLMTYDGGRQSPAYNKQTDGVYFTYAPAPWGPWATPQLVFNATRDGGYGTFMHHFDAGTDTEIGPVGPTIGSQISNDPDSTNGAIYAPGLIEPLARVVGDTLLIDYTMSTWNPYTIVRMRSSFAIMPGRTLGAGAPPATPTPRLLLEPNPFSARTRVSFSLPRAGTVEVGVYDLEGRRVRLLGRGPLAAGAHELSWDGGSDAGARARPGVYFVRVRTADATLVRRVVRLD